MGINESRNKLDEINVALSIWDLTDRYNRHVSVTMISILENTHNKISFHLFYDKRESEKDLACAERNTQRYLEIGRRYNADIFFHHVEIPEYALQNKLVRMYTPGSLLRFFIPEVISNADKVIYLDTDITVTLDIAELWNIDISGYDIAAVYSPHKKMQAINDKKNGLDPKLSFNSGVIVFNINAIRQKYNLPEIAFRMMSENTSYQLPDQEVLNVLFQKSGYALPNKFNYNPQSLVDLNANEGCIIHFMGRLKPWHVYSSDAGECYWKYLLLSPWVARPDELLQYLLEAPSMEKSLEVLPKWLMQKNPRKLLPFLWKLVVVIPAKVIWRDFKYLIRFKIFGKNPML